jgi:hypothetical protein
MTGIDWSRLKIVLPAAVIGIGLFVFPVLGFLAALLAMVVLASAYSREF